MSRARRRTTSSIKLLRLDRACTRDEGCPSRLGWGKASHASHRGERAPGTERELGSTSRPLTRGNSTPRSPHCLGHTGMGGEKSADRPGTWRAAQAECPHPGRVSQVRRRACGSIRWQKSTDDAWSSAPGRDERQGKRWSSLPNPSKVGSGRRKSVGSRSRVAKPCGRWRVRVRDQARKRRVERASGDGRRLGSAPSLGP